MDNDNVPVRQIKRRRMSSREIAELTGKRHDHVLRDIDKINEAYVEMSLPKVGERDYIDDRGKTYREFLLTKTQSLDLLSGYDRKLRIAIIRRWKELELQAKIQKYKLPRTHGEALIEAGRLALENDDLKEENKQLIAKNTILEPKGEAYDHFLSAKNAQPMSEVARILGIGKNTLYELLRKNKILMISDQNLPYQKYLNAGYFTVIDKTEGTGLCYNTAVTLVTPKGIEFIRRVLLCHIEILADNEE